MAPSIPTVIVDAEAPTDAALIQSLGGNRMLVLRPMQTFSNAVAQITQLLPSMHPDQVRGIVRLHLPEAADFDSLESSWRGARQPVTILPFEPDAQHRRRSMLRRVLAHTAVWSVVSLSVVAYFVASGAENKPYESAAFKRFVTLGQMMCDPIDATHARCTDVDGAVMLSTVLTSPDSTLFNFSYGPHKVGMRVFPSEVEARAWANEDGSKGLYANLRQSGRYVFYGTDRARVNTYASLVDRSVHKHGLGAVEVPDRLGGLSMGALNLPGGDRIQLVSATQKNAVLDVLGDPGQGPTVSKEVTVTAAYLPAQHVTPLRPEAVPGPTLPQAVQDPEPPLVEVTAGPVHVELPAPAQAPTPHRRPAHPTLPPPPPATEPPTTATLAATPPPTDTPTLQVQPVPPPPTPSPTTTSTPPVGTAQSEPLTDVVEDTIEALMPSPAA